MSLWKKVMRKREPFEVAILIVSSAAILGILGGLVMYTLSFESGPPDLHVRVSGPEDGNHYLVSVTNQGATTATHVVVGVTVGEESHDLEFIAVPKGEVEEALVEAPAGVVPEAVIRSYAER